MLRVRLIIPPGEAEPRSRDARRIVQTRPHVHTHVAPHVDAVPLAVLAIHDHLHACRLIVRRRLVDIQRQAAALAVAILLHQRQRQGARRLRLTRVAERAEAVARVHEEMVFVARLDKQQRPEHRLRHPALARQHI